MTVCAARRVTHRLLATGAKLGEQRSFEDIYGFAFSYYKVDAPSPHLNPQSVTFASGQSTHPGSTLSHLG